MDHILLYMWGMYNHSVYSIYAYTTHSFRLLLGVLEKPANKVTHSSVCALLIFSLSHALFESGSPHSTVI